MQNGDSYDKLIQEISHASGTVAALAIHAALRVAIRGVDGSRYHDVRYECEELFEYVV